MYEDTLLGTADSAVRLVTDIDMSSVGLNPDLGNIYRLHRPIEDFLVSVEKCMPHANYWHMKSYSRDVDAEGHVTTVPAPMAFGTANYRQAIQIATDAGFDGPDVRGELRRRWIDRLRGEHALHPPDAGCGAERDLKGNHHD